MSRKIVILGGNGISTTIIYNTINERFGIEKVILEEKINKITFLKRRLKKIGLLTVFGQILFQISISKILLVFSKNRIAEILKKSKLKLEGIPKDKLINVKSVNDQLTIDLLKKLKPDLIIVNGTRIISKKVLTEIDSVFINMHAGITPTYRGVHGAYWAYVNKEDNLAGVTVHYVDKGIDTGEIIAQKLITKSKSDNFITYPYLQLTNGIGMLIIATELILSGERPKVKSIGKQSGLYSHPTLFDYIYNFFIKGVK